LRPAVRIRSGFRFRQRVGFMRKMKGFMHVVEILLIIVLLFFVFSQFASIPGPATDWQKTKLGMMADDALRALDARGIDWFNRSEVDAELNRTLPENVIYAVTLQNAIKPEIKLGCLCSDSELAEVNSMLSPGWFVINGRKTTFDVVKVASASELFSLDFDVALVRGYEDLTSAATSAALRNFLGHGKGVVEIADLTVIDGVQKTVFGLDSGSTISDSTGIIFPDAGMQDGREANVIYERFIHVPLFYDNFDNPGQWAGDASLSAFGKTPPAVELAGEGCAAGQDNAFIFTRFYDSFTSGEIDFDVYLEDGAYVLVGFAKGGGYAYLASLSANRTAGYSSFYRSPPLGSTGSNASVLVAPLAWSHVKITAEYGSMKLYVGGENVAGAQAAGLDLSNISLSNRCGKAYIDNMRVTEPERKEFASFLVNENVTQLNGNQNKMLLVQKASGLPACVINYNIEGIGSGRTAWLSNATSLSDDYATLVKALVAWAAGSEHRLVKAEIKKPASSYIYKSLGNEMQENMKIILELGYLY